MNEELTKLMQERWSKIPPEVQQAVLAPDLPQKVLTVGTTHKLHVDQTGKLEEEVVLLLLGITEPDDFPSHLAESLSVDAAEAEKIASDIGERVVIPIRTLMQSGQKISPVPALAPAAVSTPLSSPSPVSTKVKTPEPALHMQGVLEPKSAPVIPTTPIPASILSADVMLSQPTVELPKTPSPLSAPVTTMMPANKKTEPPKPGPYKADPYREPVE